MTQERKKFLRITSENICNAYSLLYKKGLVSFSLPDDAKNKIDALVASITNTHFGEEIYKSHEEKAVAYLYFIIKNHAFTDGNKRTACLSFSIICDLNNITPKYDGFTLDELAVFLEKKGEKDYQMLIKAVSMLLFPYLT